MAHGKLMAWLLATLLTAVLPLGRCCVAMAACAEAPSVAVAPPTDPDHGCGRCKGEAPAPEEPGEAPGHGCTCPELAPQSERTPVGPGTVAGHPVPALDVWNASPPGPCVLLRAVRRPALDADPPPLAGRTLLAQACLLTV